MVLKLGLTASCPHGTSWLASLWDLALNTELLEELLHEEEEAALDFKRAQYPFEDADNDAKSGCGRRYRARRPSILKKRTAAVAVRLEAGVSPADG